MSDERERCMGECGELFDPEDLDDGMCDDCGIHYYGEHQYDEVDFGDGE